MDKKNRFNYSLWDNLKFMLSNMWHWDAKGTALTVLRAPFMVIVPLIGLYLTRTVISFFETGANLNQIITGITMLCIAMAVCMIILTHLNGQKEQMMHTSVVKFGNIILKKMMSHDYEYNESSKGLSDALKATQNRISGLSAIENVSSFFGNLIGLVSYAVIIIALNPFIILIICVTTIISYFLLKRITVWNHKNKDKWLTIDRRIKYLEAVSRDMDFAKDMRLYNMAGWLRSMFYVVLKQRLGWQRSEEIHAFGIELLCSLLSLIRESATYGLLVYMMYQRNMTAADFVLYFGIIGGFTAWFDALATNLYSFDQMNVSFNEMRMYIDHKNQGNRGVGIPLPKTDFSVIFQNVSYQFSDNDKPLFNDFNLTISKGERLAIVGPNDAGKTTLVKLLCGLYRPKSGVILVDGHPIDAYNMDEYYSLFSAVFQDITILPMTIRQNITCKTTNEINEKRLAYSLELSGFCDVVKKFKNSLDTYLVRGVYPDAVDLSGGEVQKLALARALYQDGKFLILDEPTAALDPIAESYIYQQYSNISAAKTSVFISHRLVSTKFCDRIIFLENGKIIEDGSHDELMAKKGKYYELFEIQNRYYREGANME